MTEAPRRSAKPLWREIGRRVTRAREASGMTVVVFAKLVGVSRQAMHQCERGERGLGVENLYRIALVSHRSIDFFLPPVSVLREQIPPPLMILWRVTELMKERDWTPADLAQRTGIQPRLITRFTQHGFMGLLDTETVDLLCQAFKVEPGALFRWERPAP